MVFVRLTASNKFFLLQLLILFYPDNDKTSEKMNLENGKKSMKNKFFRTLADCNEENFK